MPKKIIFFILVFPVVGIITAIVNYIKFKLWITLLEDFKDAYIKWRNTVEQIDIFEFTNGDLQLRSKVLSLKPHASKIYDRVGQRFASFPALAVGGPVFNISVIDECLNLNLLASRNIRPVMIYDELVRAISIYETKSKFMIFNTINPIYWIKSVLTILVRIPFFLFEIAGFSNVSARIETSIWGKLLKLIILVLAIAADLHSFGLLKGIWDYIKDIF